jgi:hypothetical protein
MKRRTIVLFGYVTDSDVATVTELANGRGFTVIDGDGYVKPEALVNALANEHVAKHPLPLPTWRLERLAYVKLPEAIPSLQTQERVTSILTIDHISNAYQLTQRTFSAYLRPEMGLSAHFRARAYVVEFMAENGIPFQDLNPAAVFRHKIVDIPELANLHGALLERGIFWLEMLAFITPEALMRSGTFKAARIKTLREVLSTIGLSFRDGF